MTAVSIKDGISYGAKLLVYVIGVFLLGGLIGGLGAGLVARGGSGVIYLFGVILGALGVLVVYSGMLGIGYKMVADAVEKGNREAR